MSKDKVNMEIVREDFYKFIEPNLTTENNGVIYFNTNSYGTDNAYPEALIDRYKNSSSIHSNFINLKRRLTYASGLFPEDKNNQKLTDFLNKVNIVGDDTNDVYLKCCLDYAIQEQAAFQVIYNAAGKVAQIIHTDISKLRAEQPNDLGVVEAWYYSPDWVTVNGSVSFTDRRYKNKKAVRLPLFDPSKYKEEPRQLVIMKRYTSGNPIYAIPSYNAGIPAIDTDYELSLFNLNSVKQGFLPSAIITLLGNPSPEEKQRFINEFNKKTVGGKNVKALFEWVDSMDQKSSFQRMAADPNAKVMEEIKNQVMQDIATAHGGALELAGVNKDSGSDLGGDANKLNIARLTFVENVIVDFQRVLVKGFNKVFRHNGLDSAMVTNEPLKIAQPIPQPDDLTEDERRDLLYGLPPKVDNNNDAQQNVNE